MLHSNKSYYFGLQAENMAAEFLQQHGYTILARRYRSGYGEIDLIASKDSALVAVEVKARTHAAEIGEIVSQRQCKRIIKGMQGFISTFPEYSKCSISFDIVLVSQAGAIEHLANAWNAIDLYANNYYV